MVNRPRFLALWFPTFRLERCGYSAEDAAALVSEERGMLRVVAITPAAAAAGLKVGLPAAEARALLPEVSLEVCDTAGEERDFRALGGALGVFSDRVRPLALSSPDRVQEHRAFVLAIDGLAQWFGSEREGLAEVVAYVEGLGHRARAAIADDPVAAGALAAWGPAEPAIVPPGDPAAQAVALAGLQTAALPLREEVLEALRAVGVETIGAWAALDPASVSDRYGPEAARLHGIARGGVGAARGSEPLGGVILEEEIPEARVVFPEPVAALEPIAFVLPGLCATLAAHLERRCAQAVQLGLRLRLDRGSLPVQRIAVRVGRPTAHARTLERVLRVRLQSVRFEAPISELHIRVEESCAERTTQLGLHDRAQAAEAIPDLVARLVDTLGEAAVFSPRLCDAWRPEAAWRPEGGLGLGEESRVGRSPVAAWLDARGRVDPVAVHERWGGGGDEAPRPSLLTPVPEGLEVREEAGQPALLRLPGGWERVRRARGPERLSGEWWAEPFDRAYWVVEVGAATWWIYQDARDARWFVHGWFD
jgi:protein ImuB